MSSWRERAEKAEQRIAIAASIFFENAVEETLNVRRTAETYGKFHGVTLDHEGQVKAYVSALYTLDEDAGLDVLQAIKARVEKAADEQPEIGGRTR